MASDIQPKNLANLAAPKASAAATLAAPRASSSREMAPPAAPKTSFADELAKTDTVVRDAARQKPTTVPGDANANSARDAARDSAADRADQARDVGETRGQNTSAPVKPKDDAKDGDGAREADDGRAPAKAGAKAASRAAAPIKQAAVAHKRDVDDTPVVALLTGHVEKLDPSAIPSLVTGNGFLTQAMGQADVKSFMEEAHSVQDLVDQLGLPASLLDDAKKLGLDLEEKISPNELFRALGVDPQRVFSELRSLKDSLLTGGLVPYLQRAQALKGADLADATKAPILNAEADRRIDPKAPIVKKSTLPTNVGSAIGPAAGVIPGGAMTVPAAQPNAQANISPFAATAVTPTQPLAIGPQVGPPRQQGARDLPIGALSNDAKSAAGLKDLAPKLAALAAAQGFDPATLMSLTKIDPQSMPDLLQIVKPEELAAILPDPLRDAANVVNAPKMAAATFDAFALMGDRMKTGDVTKLDMMKLSAPLASLKESEGSDARSNDETSAMSAAAPAWTAATMPQTLAAHLDQDGSAGINRLMVELSKGRGVSGAPQAAFSLDAVLKNLGAVPVAGDADDSAGISDGAGVGTSSDRSDSVGGVTSGIRNVAEAAVSAASGVAGGAKKVGIDELRLVAPADLRAVGDAKSSGSEQQKLGGDSGDKRDQGDERSGVADKITDTLRAHAHLAPGAVHRGSFEAAVTGGAASAKEATLSPEARLEMMQKIVDRASFLAKAGGGTVRLDLGSAELGRLELAVRMTDGDRVDLRILTGSTRARDLMTNEMAHLRDALGVQQIQLGKVEVGVGGRDQRNASDQRSFGGNGFAGGSFQNFPQGGQQFYRGERDALDSFGGASRANRASRGIGAVQQVGGMSRGVVPTASLSGASIQVRV